MRQQHRDGVHIMIVVLGLIVGVISPALAVTRYASVAGGGAAPCTNSTTRCTLQTAMNQAVAGDTVLVGNGTYNGTFTMSANGSSGAKITLQAENRHQAFMVGSGQGHDDSNIGLVANGTWQIVDGFDVSQYSIGIEIGGANVEVRNNLVHEVGQFGIRTYGQTSTIHDNVVCCMLQGVSDYGFTAGIWLVDNTQNHQVLNNIVYSVTDGQYIENSFGRMGYGIFGVQNNDGTLVQNNVVMDSNKSLLRFTGESGGVCASTATVWTENVTIRDNIFAYGQGGMVIGEELNSSTVTNNLLVDMLHFTDIKGNNPGNNIFTHNTFLVGPHTNNALVFEPDCFEPGTGSYNSTVLSNLWYATFANPGPAFYINLDGSVTTSNYNLFWRPGATSSWGVAVTGANDIMATGSVPSFVNAAAGDYTLAAGSPGKGSAHDSTDRGINFNAARVNIMKQILTLPTTENSTSGTSTSFTVTPNHYYQAFAYLPDSGAYTGSETWTVAGQSHPINTIASKAMGPPWITNAPNRYMYIGTVFVSGSTLNVSWGTSNSTSKILIRRLPTPTEAYTIMQAAATGPPTVNFTATSPVNLGTSSTLTYSASSNGGTGLTCTASIVSGQADATWTGRTSAQLIAGTGSPLTGATRTVDAPTTYRLACSDSNGAAPNVDQTVTISHPAAIWLMNDGSGTNVLDSSGNTLTAQLCNGVTCPAAGAAWVTGVGGTALSFNGTSTYARSLDNPLLDFTGDFTAALWVKSTQAAVVDTFPIFLSKSANNSTGWWIQLHQDTDPLWHAAIHVGSVTQTVPGVSNLADGAWHHVAVRRQGTTLTMFEAGSPVNTGTVDGSNLSNAGNLTIGTWDTLSACCFYNGAVDQVELYPYALSNAEIAALAAVALPKISTLVDAFTGASVDTGLWSVYQPSAYTVSQPGGVLQIANSTSQNDGAALTSIENFDATASCLTAELVAAGNAVSSASAYVWLRYYRTGGNNLTDALEIGVNNNQLSAKVFNVSVGTPQTYNATNHRWVRMCEAGGTTTWGYRSTAGAWNTLHSQATPTGMDDVVAEIGAGTFPGIAGGLGIAQWDNVNNATTATVVPAAPTNLRVVSP